MLPQRVVAIVSLAALAPFGAEGLDWFAGMVESGVASLQAAHDGRAEMEAFVELLDERGHAHSGIKDIGPGYILEFRDPDNIALELFAAKA